MKRSTVLSVVGGLIVGFAVSHTPTLSAQSRPVVPGPSVPIPVPPGMGGTGVASPTAHTIPVNEGSSAQTHIGMTSGQLVVGQGLTTDPIARTVGGDVASLDTAGNFTLQNLAHQWAGASSETQYGVIYGNGSSVPGATAAGTDGQLFLGQTSAAPAFESAGGDVASVSSSGNFTLKNLSHQWAATTSETQNGVLFGNGTSVPGATAAGTNGQLLVGQTSSSPAFETVGGDLTCNASGTMTLNTVNSNVGTFGSTLQIPTVTVNAKGLITAASSASYHPGLTVVCTLDFTDTATWGSNVTSLSNGSNTINGQTWTVSGLSGSNATITINPTSPSGSGFYYSNAVPGSNVTYQPMLASPPITTLCPNANPSLPTFAVWFYAPTTNVTAASGAGSGSRSEFQVWNNHAYSYFADSFEVSNRGGTTGFHVYPFLLVNSTYYAKTNGACCSNLATAYSTGNASDNVIVFQMLDTFYATAFWSGTYSAGYPAWNAPLNFRAQINGPLTTSFSVRDNAGIASTTDPYLQVTLTTFTASGGSVTGTSTLSWRGIQITQ